MVPTPSTVFAVCTRMYVEFNRDGEVSVVSVHPTLETANNAARQARNDYVDEYDEDWELNPEDDDECGPGVKFFDELEHSEGELWQVYVEERPYSGSTSASIQPTSSYGPMVTIPAGQHLLRGARFLFTGALESMDRETAENATEIYGGRVVHNASDADYVVIGSNPHTHIIQAANTYGVEKVNEGFLYTLIRHGVPNYKTLRCERLQELSSNVSTPARAGFRNQLAIRSEGVENACSPPSKRMRL